MIRVIENYMRSGEVALSKYKLSLNLSYLGFVNAIGNCMLIYGVFGLLLYLKLFWNIWKESDLYSKCYAKKRICQNNDICNYFTEQNKLHIRVTFQCRDAAPVSFPVSSTDFILFGRFDAEN